MNDLEILKFLAKTEEEREKIMDRMSLDEIKELEEAVVRVTDDKIRNNTDYVLSLISKDN